MSFKDIPIFSSIGNFVKQSRTICAILVESRAMPSIFSEIILILDWWFKKRCILKSIQFLSLVAILFCGAKPFVQYW